MSKSKVEFIEEIMGYFIHPFLPSDLVTTRRVDDIYGEPALNIKIGRRDVTILEDSITGAGTTLEDENSE